MLSKHRRRKLERYGNALNGLDGIALYFIEKRDAKKKRYRKPGHNALTQTERENLIQV